MHIKCESSSWWQVDRHIIKRDTEIKTVRNPFKVVKKIIMVIIYYPVLHTSFLTRPLSYGLESIILLHKVEWNEPRMLLWQPQSQPQALCSEQEAPSAFQTDVFLLTKVQRLWCATQQCFFFFSLWEPRAQINGKAWINAAGYLWVRSTSLWDICQ